MSLHDEDVLEGSGSRPDRGPPEWGEPRRSVEHRGLLERLYRLPGEEPLTLFTDEADYRRLRGLVYWTPDPSLARELATTHKEKDRVEGTE